jgi:hypothetical protein
MSQFTDPEDLDRVVADIKGCKTIGELIELVNNVFSGWIIGLVPRYCESYPHLTQNWNYICNQIGVRPAMIVIVSYLSDDNEHSLMNIFLEAFYKAGFVVRLVEHFAPCSRCYQMVVPSREIYEKFRENMNILRLPLAWTSTCRQCNESNEDE